MNKDIQFKAACVFLAGLLFLFLFTRSDYQHLTPEADQKDPIQVENGQGINDRFEDESKLDKTDQNGNETGEINEGSKISDPKYSDHENDSNKELDTDTEDKDPNTQKKDPNSAIKDNDSIDDEDTMKEQEEIPDKTDQRPDHENGSNDLFEDLPKVDGSLDPGTIPEPEPQKMNQKVTASLSQKEIDAIIRTLESNEYSCTANICRNDSLFANTTSSKKNSITIDLDQMIMTGTYYFGTEPEVMKHRYDLKTGQGALVNITRKLYCVSNKAKETMTCYDADSDSPSPALDDGLAAQYEQEIDRQLERFS